MSRFLAVVALATMTIAASPAAAATIKYIPGPNYDEMVHNDGQGPGTTVTLKTKPSGYLVDYTANATLTPNGNGFAKQNGPFSWVTIDPLTVGFTKMGFTLTPDGKNNVDYTFDILVNFVGGGSQLLSGVLPNNGKVDVWADGTEVFDSLTIKNLMGSTKKTAPMAYNFADIRQTSFDAAAISAVPEPATWAMMIVGFGAAGAMVRTRRRAGAPSLA